MKKRVRTLDFYGFDDDNTMVKYITEDTKGMFYISKTKEIKNMKYVRTEGGEEEETQEDNNNETGNTQDNG